MFPNDKTDFILDPCSFEIDFSLNTLCDIKLIFITTIIFLFIKIFLLLVISLF